MDLPLEELKKILSSANRILLTGQASPTIDVLCTAVAWQHFLIGQKKLVDLVLAGQIQDFKFFPDDTAIKNQLKDVDKFKIILDISKTKVKQLSYDVKGDELQIDIVPSEGTFSSQDLRTDAGDYKYDLVICLGALNLESLGKIFSEHHDFFHRVPIINIDRSVLNENFGQLNIIESNSTSLAEISYHLLEESLDKDIATCLLAGMIAATNSFQSPKVSPNTLELASQLIIKGADRAQIIETLYRTKDIDTLKNWGKVLSRLRKVGNVITSFLNHDEADDLPQDFQEMVRDLILSSPKTQVAIIFYQLELYQTEAWLYTIDNINALDLTKDLSAQGDRRFVKIVLDKDLEESRTLIVKKISGKLEIINSL
jgi:nanoRNase/pAp phosphatase (c-di-AMP/oligoRNAs hydrolase)